MKAKSQFVASKFLQSKSIKFGEIFAAAVSSSSVRLLSSIPCERDWDLYHFDTDQAFEQSKSDENVFLRMLNGWRSISDNIMP